METTLLNKPKMTSKEVQYSKETFLRVNKIIMDYGKNVYFSNSHVICYDLYRESKHCYMSIAIWCHPNSLNIDFYFKKY